MSKRSNIRTRPKAKAKAKKSAVDATPRASAEAGARPVRRQRSKWLDRLGWYEYTPRPLASTTRQVSGLFLATSGAPTSHEGIFIGKEMHSGWPFFHDVFAAYENKIISTPNVVVIGDVGVGKSSFIKTWGVIRQLMLGRRVCVVDKKRQQKRGPDGRLVAEGEYADLARALNVEPIRFVIGNQSAGSRINILDPAIAAQSTAGSDTGASQMQLLRAVLREALGRDVQPLEGRALSVARKVAVDEARQAGRVATIKDVLKHLDDPTEASLQHVNHRTTTDDLAVWGQEAAAELERLVSEDLAGLIDGETSSDISLEAGLTVFDVSALPDDGPAVRIVMAIVNSWLRAVLDNQHDTVPTVFAVEEGWHLVEGSFAAVTRRNQKIARGEAMMNVTALHHISDIDEASPAIASIKEAATVVLFKQERHDDAERCVRLFNLPPTSIDTLMSLPQGAALIKIGINKPVIVTHMRSTWEVAVTDTDDAMHSAATVALHAAVALDEMGEPE